MTWQRPLVITAVAILLCAIVWSLYWSFSLHEQRQAEEEQEEIARKLQKNSVFLWMSSSHDAEEQSRLDLLKNPEVVRYSGQQLTESVFRDLGKMERLKDVDLLESGIEDDWLKYIEHLRLTRISLAETKLSDRGLEHISKIHSLEILDIHATSVTDKGVALLKGLRSLDNLDVSATRITDASIGTILQFKNLHRLDISDTRISDAGVAALTGLDRLSCLDLEGTKISANRLSTLKRFKYLDSLLLPRCELTDRDLSSLSSFTQLKLLCLARNARITDDGLLKLKSLKNLKQLQIFDCPALSAGAIAELEKSLPGCKISRTPRPAADAPADLYKSTVLDKWEGDSKDHP